MTERLHDKAKRGELTVADAVNIILTRRDRPTLSGFLTRRDVEAAGRVLADWVQRTALATALDPTDDQAIDHALDVVRVQMTRTVAQRGPDGARLHSSHEGLGVLVEEFTELTEAIHSNDYDAQVREAVQIAAVAARWPLDFGPGAT